MILFSIAVFTLLFGLVFFAVIPKKTSVNRALFLCLLLLL